jgi:hypothetical protein
VAAILKQPDDGGQQHPVEYKSTKLTAAERNYPAWSGWRWYTSCGLQALAVGERSSAAAWLRVGLGPADGQPGDHVAEDEQAFEQDVRSLARRDRALPLRRDARTYTGSRSSMHRACRQGGGLFLVLCGLLYRLGQGSADRLCIPAGGGQRMQMLRECHDGPLGGHFSRAKMGSLVRHLAFWGGLDRME